MPAAIASEMALPATQATRMFSSMDASLLDPDEGPHAPALLRAAVGEEAFRIAQRAEAAAVDLAHPGAGEPAAREPVEIGHVLAGDMRHERVARSRIVALEGFFHLGSDLEALGPDGRSHPRDDVRRGPLHGG